MSFARIRLSLGSMLLALVLQAGASVDAWGGGFVDQLIRQGVERRLEQTERNISLLGILKRDFANWLSFLSEQSIMPDETFGQRIDHFSAEDSRIFQQRYYINSAHASGPDAPVFYYVCGEATCTAGSLRGAIETYAKRFSGHLVALEHRFYGKSQPFPDLSAENLQYLSTAQALADLARFQEHVQNERGLKGKWIVLGGSYPGSLAAYYRQKFPHLAAGSLSSSGPVQAKENFEEYDWVVADRTGPVCAQAIRETVKQIEDLMETPEGLALLKAKFDATEIIEPLDFLYVVADMAAAAIQYGMKEKFCETILKATDRVDGYAEAGKEAFRVFGITPLQSSFQSAISLNPDDYLTGFGMRQWMYQSCTEYGYFQNAYHDPAISVRSARINSDYHRQVCERLFGTPPLDTSYITNVYYAPLLEASTSRILYTNGSDDPWSVLSISQELGNATNPNTSAYRIEGAAHCDDLRLPRASDSAALQGARETFSQLVEQWLR